MIAATSQYFRNKQSVFWSEKGWMWWFAGKLQNKLECTRTKYTAQVSAFKTNDSGKRFMRKECLRTSWPNLVVGLDELRGLFQLKQFCDSS